MNKSLNDIPLQYINLGNNYMLKILLKGDSNGAARITFTHFENIGNCYYDHSSLSCYFDSEEDLRKVMSKMVKTPIKDAWYWPKIKKNGGCEYGTLFYIYGRYIQINSNSLKSSIIIPQMDYQSIEDIKKYFVFIFGVKEKPKPQNGDGLHYGGNQYVYFDNKLYCTRGKQMGYDETWEDYDKLYRGGNFLYSKDED